jgi:hypothetical protein
MLSAAAEADRRERSQNNALRAQVESHRAFARRIQQLMAATQTSNSELQAHLHNVQQLELRQLCVDACDSALQQGLGLLRDSLVSHAPVRTPEPPLPPSSTSTSPLQSVSEWKLAIVDGDRNITVLFRQPSDGANRLQLRMDVHLPTTVAETVSLLHGHTGNAASDPGLQAIYEATETAAQQLYADSEWGTPVESVADASPTVCATYTRENLNGSLSATVAALMRTRLRLSRHALRLPAAIAAARSGADSVPAAASESEIVDCFANVSANASHLLPDPARMSPPVVQDLMTNVHLIYGLPTDAEGRQTSRLTILDASPWHGIVRSGFGLTATTDGTPVFVGAWAKRAKATCQWLMRAAESVAAERMQVDVSG